MTQKQIQNLFFLGLVLGFAVVAFLLIRPYFAILAAAIAMAALFRPLFHKLGGAVSGRAGLAALAVTLIVLFVVVIPVSGVSVLFGREVADVYGTLNGFLQAFRQGGGLTQAPPLVRWLLENTPLGATLQNGFGAEVVTFVSGQIVNIFSNIGNALFGTFLFFISFYYFLKDGASLRQNFFALSPLPDKADTKIYERLTITINAVIRGTVIVAVIQGGLAGLGFWIFGVGAPVLLGSITIFASLIPAIGTALVIVPTIAYLVIKGSLASAVGLAIWGSIAVGLIDNLLKPKLIERQLKIHPLLILFSIIGGINLFGFLGFIVGPLILAVGWALGEIYHEEFSSSETSATTS